MENEKMLEMGQSNDVAFVLFRGEILVCKIKRFQRYGPYRDQKSKLKQKNRNMKSAIGLCTIILFCFILLVSVEHLCDLSVLFKRIQNLVTILVILWESHNIMIVT